MGRLFCPIIECMYDIDALQQFYNTTLGAYATAEINRQWLTMPSAGAQDIVAALGYGVPYLSALAPHEGYKLCFMPVTLGAVLEQPYPQCLVEPHLLPLHDASLYRLLLVHVLEYETNTKAILREAWRVIQDDGALLLIVPNRGGLWSSLTNQPFGQGMPYSSHQIQQLLHQTGFTIEHMQRCLHYLPCEHPLLLRTAMLCQPIIRHVLPMLAGVLVIQARKTLLRPTLVGKKTPIFTAKLWPSGAR